MTRVALHGFYGYGNLGDEAILTALKNEFKKFNGTNITVFTNEYAKVRAMHDVETCPEIGRRSLLKRIGVLFASNIFVLGGGGFLKDYGENPANLKRWLRILDLAQKLKRKTALCSIGVENIRFDESRKLIKKVLNNTAKITVRDELSKNILQECGVSGDIEVISDPVLLLADA